MSLSLELSSYASWLLRCGTHALLCLPILCMTALSCITLFLQSGRARARRTKRTSYDKGARQLTLLATLVGWICVCVSQGLCIWYYALWDAALWQELLEAPLPFLCAHFPLCVLECTWLFFFLQVLGLSNGLLVWKFLGKHPLLASVHSLVSCCCGLVWALLLLLLLLFWVHNVSFQPTGDLPTDWERFSALVPGLLGIQMTSVRTLLDSLSSARLCSYICLIPLFLGMPAVLGSLGILLLRPFHDYGRDHYTIVVTWCMDWAKRTGWLLVVLLLAAICWAAFCHWDQLTLMPFCSLLLLLLLFLLASLVWTGISRSTLPLRHKIWMVIADIFAVAALFLMGFEILALA